LFSSGLRSTIRNAIQQDSPGRWIVPRFVLGVLGLSVAGLALGLAMFLLVPRVWIGGGGIRSQGESRGAQAVIGFSGEVRLGQIGQILESTERVMRVQIFDRDAGNKPMTVEEFAAEYGLTDPLFRGSVLERYQDGRWKSARVEEQRISRSLQENDLGLIRQEYVLDLVNSEVLFAMRPITMARLDAPYGPMNYNPETGVFAGSIEGRDPIRYFVYSSRRKPDDPQVRQNEFGEIYGSRALTPQATTRYLQKPAAGIDQLIELARQVADEEMQSESSISGAEVSPERRKAVALWAYLRDEERFTYSLNMAVEDPRRDPVEEFLFVRKQGHCEYFASALALMLRSEKIPARLVTGFKGADFHKSEGYYEVQQRHAHVWVEAWVDNQWIVLDPTPEARDEAVRSMASQAGFWTNARNSIQSMWSTYVVSLSLNRQQEALYEPLQGSVSSGWGSVSHLLSQVAAGVGWIKGALASPEQLLTPRGTALALGVLIVAWALVNLARRSRRRARRRGLVLRRPNWIVRAWAWLAMRLTGRSPDPAGMIVEFYEQFLSLASAAGFARRDNQTQREFARQLEEVLGDRLAAAELSRFPSELAELFYKVRFGAGRLEPLEAGDIEQRLSRLAGALAPP
jgi:transglutaminase-like putative cysteine protease